jgi:hypothetical protein
MNRLVPHVRDHEKLSVKVQHKQHYLYSQMFRDVLHSYSRDHFVRKIVSEGTAQTTPSI